eukprot:390450-Pyramimonas_sp.AAC.1
MHEGSVHSPVELHQSTSIYTVALSFLASTRGRSEHGATRVVAKSSRILIVGGAMETRGSRIRWALPEECQSVKAQARGNAELEPQ